MLQKPEKQGGAMAYKYEKVNQQLLVPQIEDQLLMYIQEKNIEIIFY